MTLSVLIPTYNYNARALVTALLRQIEAEQVEAEVIVGDDASTSQTEWLDEVAEWKGVRVLRTTHNLGRSANRNRMAEAANGEWLLFMDCDAKVEDNQFLHKYLIATKEAEVICGGLYHPKELPGVGYELRWKYELKAEPRFAAEYLNKLLAAGKHVPFRTFSFLIHRDVFKRAKFDEQIQAYGCEDVLFGMKLDAIGARVLYINNPLLNGDIETSAIYLQKTEEAVRTLHGLNGQLLGYYRLENVANKVKRWHLDGLIRLGFRLTKQMMRRNLLGRHPSLTIFSLYKLGYYLSL